ncbi:MAG: MotA/TolQ/ExbB proton channel family protein [Elusimicrobiota bacterium]|jgi:biopolymer transport protein ExbB
MPDINILEVLRTSFTLILLLFCSILTLTFALERWWYFRCVNIDGRAFMAALKQLLESDKFPDALKFCKETPGPLASLMRVAVESRSKSKSEVLALLNAQQIDERARLERYLGIIGTMGNTAPFIGLFGTVVGIIRAFHDLALSGSGGPSVVAAGIAEALVATAGGLAVAIPSVVLYNYFMKKVKDLSSDMEASGIRVLVYLGLG